MRSGVANSISAVVPAGLALIVLFGVLGASTTAYGKKAANVSTADHSTAARLVVAAADAQQAGDATRSYSLLRQAVRVSPDYELARWQLGQLKVDGEWLAVEESQRRAAADPKQTEYLALRKEHGETPQGQLALARWCRRNGLGNEATFHWASVLSAEPANQEALNAVRRRWHNGQLLTPEEIVQQKAQARDSRRGAKEWAPKIAKWRRDITSTDAARCDAALDEISAINDAKAIPSLEALTLGRDAWRKKTAEECELIGLAFLKALEGMPSQAATESIVRHAVLSPTTDIRSAAIERLKPRQQHAYVPLLLSGLAMPVESTFSVRTETDGSVHYAHSLYRERDGADWSFDLRRSAVQTDYGDLSHLQYTYDMYTKKHAANYSPQSAATSAAHKANISMIYGHRFASSAANIQSQIEQLNQVTEAFNALVVEVLTATTEQKFGDNPRAWWDWWQNHNEYYASDDDVERYYDEDKDTYLHGRPTYSVVDSSPPPPPPPPRRTSCFAKGTPVWTKTGQQPIESLQLGDLVLAQNIETGELKYQPVIGRTVRPPSKILKVSLGGESLRTTLGHPFWVSGVGWRMAKDLDDEAVLHGMGGSPRVEAIAADGEEEAYNLVVADFNTYFVGESGVLVHDNTARKPTRATVPGLALK
jgi:hypothetical protein